MMFEGLPANARFTSVPDLFINQFAPKLSADEIVLMLAVFNIMFNKKGYPRYVSMVDLASHPALGGRDLPALLDSAVKYGLLLSLKTGGNPGYVLNNREGLAALAQATQGESKPKEESAPITPVAAPAPPNIFTLYEENIGLITPMIAEELKDAVNTYPEEWLRDAIKESVSLNKRSWRYIQRILERWIAEGKHSHGTYQPDTERDKFVRGRYGGLVQR